MVADMLKVCMCPAGNPELFQAPDPDGFPQTPPVISRTFQVSRRVFANRRGHGINRLPDPRWRRNLSGISLSAVDQEFLRPLPPALTPSIALRREYPVYPVPGKPSLTGEIPVIHWRAMNVPFFYFQRNIYKNVP
jgi:hypothetical protein